MGQYRSNLAALLHGAGRSFERLGLATRQLAPTLLMEEAEQLTGLQEWGDAELLIAGLEALVSDLNEAANLSPLGVLLIRRKLTFMLKQWLLLQHETGEGTQRSFQMLNQPVFLTGFARTGTTLLHRLLDAHPKAHAPRLFELVSPFPITQEDGTRKKLKKAREICGGIGALTKDGLKIHPMSACDPSECQFLFQNSFVSPFNVFFHTPKHQEWLEGRSDADLEKAYSSYRTQIGAIMRCHPGLRFVGKAPGHAMYASVLPKIFLNAYIVRTHRNPYETIPSLARLLAQYWSMFSDQVKPDEVGRAVTQFFDESFRKNLEFDSLIPKARISDIAYKDLVESPIEKSGELLAHLGFDLPSEVTHALTSRFKELKKHGRYKHNYSLEEFGLSQKSLTPIVEPYLHWLEYDHHISVI